MYRYIEREGENVWVSDSCELTDEEVAELEGTVETWKVRFDDGAEEKYSAVFTHRGWLEESEVRSLEEFERRGCSGRPPTVAPKTSSQETALGLAEWGGRRTVVGLVGPDGLTYPVANVRFSFGEKEYDLNHAFTAENLGPYPGPEGYSPAGEFWLIPGARSLFREVRGTGFTMEEANHAADRALVFLLRHFGSSQRVAAGILRGAATPTPVRVQVRFNEGSWETLEHPSE